VLQLGPPLTSGAWHLLLSDASDLELHVLCENGWPDPEARAHSVLQGSLATTLQALLDELGSTAAPANGWQSELLAANTAIRGALAGFHDEHRAAMPQREACAVRSLFDALPDDALLLLGNSLPVREIDQYVSGSHKRLKVISQRGANGIDGITSTAVGAAAVHRGPSVCLLGDVSFLHDLGGLWAARDLGRPLLIAVLNNGGGRIFEQLPLLHHTQLPAARRDLWLTQHSLDLSTAAQLYGLRAECVNSALELPRAVQRALSHPGTSVLDLRVDPDSARVDRDHLLARCETLLGQS
jgi:2-succinyl-5-enolpyruvyl-6-hydroxy-3-cyclohexene-1-carboxylate synthase